MRYLLDTNTCISALNGSSVSVLARMRTVPLSQVRLCSPVKAELWFGAAKSVKRVLIEQSLTVFFGRFRSMPFDDEAARRYGEVRATLETKGMPIGPNDLLIASIALAGDLTLVTHNTAEFSRVEGLRLEDWEP